MNPSVCQVRRHALAAALVALAAWQAVAQLPQFTVPGLRVPQDSVHLDSVTSGKWYYSGVARYDLSSQLDSVRVHVYLEVLPYRRFHIGRWTYAGMGHEAFRCIDSLCQGDTGFVKPGTGKRIRWHYATPDSNSHCRIKVGGANFAYVDSLLDDSIEQNVITYNNRGLVAGVINYEHYQPRDTVIRQAPVYDTHGQLLDDNAPGGRSGWHLQNTYDSCFRLSTQTEALRIVDGGPWFDMDYSYGYVYDSRSRATAVISIPPPWDTSGRPPYVSRMGYDEYDRYNYGEDYNATASGDTIYRALYRLSYRGVDTVFLDSSDVQWLDTAHDDSCIYHQSTRYFYNPDSTLDYTWDVTVQTSSPPYSEMKAQRVYDGHENCLYTIRYARNSPADSLTVKDTSSYYTYDGRGDIITYSSVKQEYGAEEQYGYDEYGYVVNQTANNQFNTTYKWELVNLDTLPPMQFSR